MKYFWTIIIVTLSLYGRSQTNDSKISEVFGNEYLNEIKNNNSGLYDYFLGKLDVNHIVVSDVVNDKYTNAPILNEVIKKEGDSKSTISVEDFIADYQSGNFNPLKYALGQSNEFQIYRLGNTGHFLIINPIKY